MPHHAILPALVALAAAAGDPRPPPPAMRVQQLTIHERIIIRVPRVATPLAAPMPMTRWKEKKGPKCLSPAQFAGAMIAGPGLVDVMLDDGRRVRAKLDRECRALDYYPGFYIKPGMDGQVCAARDSIRVRSGASCGIADFKLLKMKR